MKNQSIFLVILSLVCSSLSAQDIIINKEGDEIKAKVLEITSAEIKYKRFDNQDGPIFTLSKAEVLLIRYENGTKDVFQNQAEESSNVKAQSSEQDLRMKGMRDSQRYYTGQNSGAGWTAAATILTTPIIGLIPAAAVSSAEPAERNLNYPDAKLMENYEYAKAYKDQAHKTKKKKVWTSYGVGSGVWLLLILLL